MQGQVNKMQGQDNKMQGQTNKMQGQDNKMQGQDNKTQGQTNKTQGQTNKTQGQTNKTQGQTNKMSDYEWINSQNFKTSEDLSAQITKLTLLRTDINTEQAELSLKLITAIPRLCPSIHLARRHISSTVIHLPTTRLDQSSTVIHLPTTQLNQSSTTTTQLDQSSTVTHLPTTQLDQSSTVIHLSTTQLKQSPTETLKIYRTVLTNIHATSHALSKHLKWQSIHADVTSCITDFDKCTLLLSDALFNSTEQQRRSLDPLCQNVADMICGEVRMGLESQVYAGGRMRELGMFCGRVGQAARFREAFGGRAGGYVEAYGAGGFDAVSCCVREDGFVDRTTIETLLTAFVSTLLPQFTLDLNQDLWGFHEKVEVFVESVQGPARWADKLLRLFLTYSPSLPPHIHSLTTLCKLCDGLLDESRRLLHGHTLHLIPQAILPTFTTFTTLLTSQPDSNKDPWKHVDLLCTHVENLIGFESWLGGFMKRYQEATRAAHTSTSAYVFLGTPERVKFEFDVAGCYVKAASYMQSILLAPVQAYLDDASRPGVQGLTRGVGAGMPLFGATPSEGVVAAAEYVLTLPQYLDLFKSREGFMKLGEDGVIAWTYLVAGMVKSVCIDAVDRDYFTNVCHVIGMD